MVQYICVPISSALLIAVYTVGSCSLGRGLLMLNQWTNNPISSELQVYLLQPGTKVVAPETTNPLPATHFLIHFLLKHK